MKLQFPAPLGWLAVAGLACSTFMPQCLAQTAQLGVKIVGGVPQLSLSGPTGTSWTIQYSSALPPAFGWLDLTNLTLLTSPTAVTDPDGPAEGTRFYRAQQLQGQSPTNVIVTNMVW